MNCETILLVDDEKEIADLLETYLTNENYEIRKFYNSLEALECVNQESISLAIIDIMMPDMDGFTMLKKFVKNTFFQ